MHIPDAAISPATSLVTAAAMLPVWATASRRVRDSLSTKSTPLLAISAAFTFTIMMFNVPAPGGTTVHAIGGGLMAVLVGPWAAIIGMTVALAVQALFFGDGGILALGANCFAMAFAQPLTAYAAYRMAAGRAPGRKRQVFAGALGAYVGLNVAALLVAVILGVQPSLYHDSAGRALYFPFDLRVTVPAIMIPHLTIAGFAEASVTAAAIAWIMRSSIPLYMDAPSLQEQKRRPAFGMVWASLLLVLAIAPLGMLASGEAWGEWDAEEIGRRAGYVPEKLSHVEENGWKGFNVLPDYLSERGAAGYVAAGLAGILIISGLLLPLSRRRKEDPPQSGGPGATVSAGEVPEWLTRQEEDSGGSAHRRVAVPHFQRTLETLTGSVHDTLQEERWQRADGLLQRLDARAKICATLVLALAASLSHNGWFLAALYTAALVAAAISRIPPGLLIGRTWAGVALFAGAVAAPMTLNVVNPGPEMLTFWSSPHLAVTWPGVAAASMLLLRASVSVTIVLTLAMTTPWHELLRGLRALRVPAPFVIVMTMAYRYLLMMMQAAAEMFTARRSRTAGQCSRAMERGFLGGAVGALFGRSLALTEEVHGAMLSRGWTGEASGAAVQRVGLADALLLLGSVCAAGLAWIAGGSP